MIADLPTKEICSTCSIIENRFLCLLSPKDQKKKDSDLSQKPSPAWPVTGVSLKLNYRSGLKKKSEIYGKDVSGCTH